jgi:hypothetical protein
MSKQIQIQSTESNHKKKVLNLKKISLQGGISSINLSTSINRCMILTDILPPVLYFINLLNSTIETWKDIQQNLVKISMFYENERSGILNHFYILHNHNLLDLMLKWKNQPFSEKNQWKQDEYLFCFLFKLLAAVVYLLQQKDISEVFWF